MRLLALARIDGDGAVGRGEEPVGADLADRGPVEPVQGEVRLVARLQATEQI